VLLLVARPTITHPKGKPGTTGGTEGHAQEKKLIEPSTDEPLK
jgi:hypothetical protein